MKKRSYVTKIIKSVVATDFKNKEEARTFFGISSNMMTVILGGRIPSKSVLDYIGYEKVDVYRMISTDRKITAWYIAAKVKAKCLEFKTRNDAAEFFDCTPQHLRCILKGERRPSKTMCTFAGAYKTDEYKKVK